MVEVIWIFGVILFGLLTISAGAHCRGKTCAWNNRLSKCETKQTVKPDEIHEIV